MDPTQGSEIRKIRPCVVIVPLSSSPKASPPILIHLVADSVKFFLDFGHIQVLVRNLAGTDQRHFALLQPRSQGFTYEGRAVT